MTTASVLDKGFVELISSMGNDSTVVNAARVSFNKDIIITDKERDEKLITYLLSNKHTSPLEHVVFTFHVKCPLFVRSQWMRHRTWSFNEISRRYTSDDIDFYVPKELRKQADSNRQASTDETIKHIIDGYCDADGLDYKGVPVYSYINYYVNSLVGAYNLMLESGVAREQARMILPQNMYTRFYATVDLHNLLHFLELRDSEHAQFEMRLYAQAVASLIKGIVPITYSVYKKLSINTKP